MVRITQADVVDFFNKVEKATDDISDTKLIEKIKSMIERKPELLKARSRSGRNCFHFIQSVELAEFIYKKDPSLINQRDNCGWLLIHYTASHGRLPIVKFIVEKETTELHATESGGTGKTPLLFACYCGHSNIIDWILTRDPSTVNHVDRRGNTALHWSARASGYYSTSQSVECAKLLLKRNAEMRLVQDNDGETPVMIARPGSRNSDLALYLESLAKHDETIADAKSFLKVLKVIMQAMEADKPAMIMTRATKTKKHARDALVVVAEWTKSIAVQAKSDIKDQIHSQS